MGGLLFSVLAFGTLLVMGPWYPYRVYPPTSTRAAMPSPTRPPSRSALPSSYATFVPLAMGALANSQGFLMAGTGTGQVPFAALQTAVGARMFRGYPENVSGFPTPLPAFNSLVTTANINNGACFAFSTNPDENGASQTATMTGIFTSILNPRGSYPNSVPPCTYEEGLNEANAAITTVSTTLSAHTYARQSQTENAPSGAVTHCSTPTGTNSSAAGYYFCPGAWLYISDGANSEHVEVTSANASAGTWTATFANDHTQGTAVQMDKNWVEAGWQYEAWENLYNNTSHPEFASIILTTIPLSYIYAADEAEGTIVPYDAAMVALSEQVGLCPSGCHLWQTPPGFTEPLSYNLNYHESPEYYYIANAPSTNALNVWREIGLAMQQLQCPAGHWASNTCSVDLLHPAYYPWQQGVYCGECLFVTGGDFCTGSANVPYCPNGANFTDLPQEITAQYIASEHFLFVSTFARDTGHVPFALEPVAQYGIPEDGVLNNAYLDLSSNPIPVMYSAGNTDKLFYDSIYNARTFKPKTLAFPNPAPSDLCVTTPTLSTYTFGPSGCTTYQVVSQSQDGNTYTVLFHRMPSSGLYPNPQATNGCPANPSFGQCPGSRAPSPYPEPTTTNYALANPVVVNAANVPIASIKQARVYHQSTTCNIPTNLSFAAPHLTPTPDPTPRPSFTRAPNTSCYAYVQTGYYTASGGSISIPFPADASATVVVMSTNLNTPIPVVSPIPMWSPRATPSPGPSGPLPYNYWRTGVFSPSVGTGR